MKAEKSLYWKCQILGWLFYSALFCSLDAYKQGLSFRRIFPFLIIGGGLIIVIGIVLSHLMKSLIIHQKVFEKSGPKQAVYLILYTCLFTLLFWFFWNLLINRHYTWTAIKNIFSDDSKYRKWFLSQYFTFSTSFLVWNLVYFIFHYLKKSKFEEAQKFKQQKKLIELEAKALRAQMNPHFIYNCMNSIKALMQEKDVDKGVAYLTTFSKLIRTLFQNCDKRQISLYDEIETCRFYTQLEAMRLNGKLKYSFEIDPNLDLKSIMVPALIIQPFIENAIWHGIVPKEEGILKVTVRENNGSVICEIDDDGIGREMSKLNKPFTPVIHESKGVKLSQARLDLEKILNETDATIETIDKYEKSTPVGTRVVITFNIL